MPKRQLDDFLEDEQSESLVDLPAERTVPNVQPLIRNVPYKLAIIGEAPGADEVREGRPFVGMSGRFLTSLISKAGIVRDACFIGNVCQHRPPANDITKFSREGEQIVNGLTALGTDLDEFQPNVCLLLGKTALWAAKGTDNIGDWRGSFFIGTKAPFVGRKCIAAYHPAACLRQYDWTPLLMFDIKKAKDSANNPSFVPPSRELVTNLTPLQIVNELEKIQRDKTLIAIDIEGYVGAMSCISVATSAQYSFIIPFANANGGSYWDNPDDEVILWRALAQTLGDSSVPKVLQNSLYDRFVLQYSYGLPVRGVVGDTMLEHWELYCELEKSLGFQCSLYTDEPFYKSDRKTDDRDAFWRYCCRDSAVTWEIHNKLVKWVNGTSKVHSDLNHDLLDPILYMENRGILYDTKLAKDRLSVVNHQIWELQYELDTLAQIGLSTDDKNSILQSIQSVLCYKRDPTQPKKGNEETYQRASRICLGTGPLTKAEKGFLNIASEQTLNIKSKGFKHYVYSVLESPKQYHAQTGELTTNYEALLKISKSAPHRSIDLALQIGSLRTRAQMLEIHADNDGRIRCGYNVVGTETGRLTCYTSPTGSGYNLQTIPAENQLLPLDHPLRSGMRDLFVADVGCYLFQCDLSGADGWTVAAHLASLGDSTMLDDYRYGIKPAKVLCYLLRHGAASLNGLSRAEIKERTKEIEKESWDYFACKIGQHGTCYLMGKRKLKDQIFIQSEGRVNMAESEVGNLQQLFTVRYRIKLWHDWLQRHLSKQSYPPKLQSASGNVRRFFNRSGEILGQALAHEPQNVTTYAIKLATQRLWNDPDNRVLANGRTLLRTEPFHTVHDSLLGQFKITDTTWAVGKIQQWFRNKITIAGIELTIPFEGAYGTNWALDDKSKVGEIPFC